jgi:hypothetical protein
MAKCDEQSLGPALSPDSVDEADAGGRPGES